MRGLVIREVITFIPQFKKLFLQMCHSIMVVIGTRLEQSLNVSAGVILLFMEMVKWLSAQLCL
jgi:hypothetical protein